MSGSQSQHGTAARPPRDEVERVFSGDTLEERLIGFAECLELEYAHRHENRGRVQLFCPEQALWIAQTLRGAARLLGEDAL